MSFEDDPLAFYGRRIIEDYHACLTAKLPPHDYDEAGVSNDKLRFLPDKKVGILGAGIGGLYTALILDSLDIEFEILEASDHVGGRLSTYKFPGGQKYDYYDVGAMYYPLPKKDEQGRYKNGIMKRLADLITYPSLNEGSDRLEDRLIPYHYKTREGPNMKPGFHYFNRVRESISNEPKGPFRGEVMGVDAAYIKAGADAITNDVVDPFVRLLAEDLKNGTKKGWERLKENNSYSVGGYMAFKYLPSDKVKLPTKQLPDPVINWCSLLCASSEGYGRALVESVFSSLAFAKVGSTAPGDVDWKCFDGGSEILLQRMAQVINKKKDRIRFNSRVKAISRGESLAITSVPHVYSHVISTLPLRVLRMINMRNAGMNFNQKNALRQLRDGPCIKIAIRFGRAWWTDELGIVGGQTYTDLPICTIVYPSHGVDSDTPSTVLIASYCWKTTDADRLGSLATPEQRDALKELVLDNLAEAHGHGITYEFLREQFRAMHVKDWAHDANTMGAFPMFGPGDFDNLYASLTYPAADECLHFAGDVISPYHPWVAGALDSAWRAVYEYLLVTRQDAKIKRFMDLWGGNAGWTTLQPRSDSQGPDLLREHLELTRLAILAGVIPYDG
ncbi:hypothetical protein PISMIDRAFT_102233 [Pisolithus microcarpus 441]|uniref:Amine oxidase domain-containing protein n=1 Tax=Pisolithus microcarpus 441 TaxID=765257 RepID=A0A0C9ZJ89_9AGAM|nr:hypothetical protein PISMIDRAFT_102233 [Pisolithus microcarpus 441]